MIVAPSFTVTSHRREGSLRIVQDGISDSERCTNWLLASLPPTVLAHISQYLEPVSLDRKEMLFHGHERPPHIYFPTTAIVSLVAALDSGETLEVGVIGREGVAGAIAFQDLGAMPCDGIVQIPGLAYRLDAGAFRQAARNFEPLSMAVGRYAHLLLVRCMQMQLCDMFHPVEQRLIRWLLLVSDLLESADIPLTHELVATMLGVRRPTVTLVVGALQRAGLIEERRGRIGLRDRKRLEAVCCDCYRLMCEQQVKVLGYSCKGVMAA